MLIKVPVLGGAERQALGFADFIIRTYNCKVQIIVTHSDEASLEFKAFADQCGIKEIFFFGLPSLTITKGFTLHNLKKTIRAILYLNKMKNEISKMKPDILIPFLNSPSKISILLYKQVKAKITFWHQLGLDSYSYDFLEKRAIKKAPFFVANAPNGLEVFKNQYKVNQKKLFVLPQYVSIKKVCLDKEDLKKELAIPNKKIIIGMIAHYREEKFHELLLNAFSKIAHNYNVHLVLLGNKDNNEETLAIFNKLNEKKNALSLEMNVSVFSGIPVEKILNILDIGVLVSAVEGTPNVVMEYMLYGLPVIATNHAGCVNLLKESPFLIPNIEEVLVEKIEDLLKNEELRIMEGEKNKSRIQPFTVENYFDSLLKIINRF